MNGSGETTEVVTLIDIVETTTTNNEKQKESAAEEIITESATERPALVDDNLIDSDLFEKALPDKNEDSQSIIQVSNFYFFFVLTVHSNTLILKIWQPK